MRRDMYQEVCEENNDFNTLKIGGNGILRVWKADSRCWKTEL